MRIVSYLPFLRICGCLKAARLNCAALTASSLQIEVGNALFSLCCCLHAHTLGREAVHIQTSLGSKCLGSFWSLPVHSAALKETSGDADD